LPVVGSPFGEVEKLATEVDVLFFQDSIVDNCKETEAVLCGKMSNFLNAFFGRFLFHFDYAEDFSEGQLITIF
jgi:hypothetical protein